MNRPEILTSRDWLLASFGTAEGLLVNVKTSSVFGLNRTALEVWQLFLSGQPFETIARALAARYDLPVENALLDVQATVARCETALPPEKEEYFVTEDNDLAIFSWGAGQQIALRKSGTKAILTGSGAGLRQALWSLSPSIISRLGYTLVHSAAVRTRSGTAALLLGKSGAGKTTTARQWALTSNVEVVCEDKLLLWAKGNDLVAWERTEDWLRGQTERWTESLRRSGQAIVEPPELTMDAEVPVGAFLELDSSRRTREQHAGYRRCSYVEGFGLLAGQIFRTASSPEQRLTALTQLIPAAARIPSYQLTVPDGLGHLARFITSMGEQFGC